MTSATIARTAAPRGSATRPSGAGPVAPAAAAPAPLRRIDLYATIHKALRLQMTDTLALMGSVDIDDADELRVALDRFDALLEACRHHLHNENRFVHPAIESVQPGASQRIADEHVHHEEQIEALQASSTTLRASPSAAFAHRTYLALAAFVAENFVHMQLEETEHNAVLWAHFSDAELLAIEGEIVASLDAAARGAVMHWMIPAINPAERAAWLGGMQRGMPPAMFGEVVSLARQRLAARPMAKLAQALGVPATPFPGQA